MFSVVVNRHREHTDVHVRVDIINQCLRPVAFLHHGGFAIGEHRQVGIGVCGQRILLAVINRQLQQIAPFFKLIVAYNAGRSVIQSLDKGIHIILPGKSHADTLVAKQPPFLIGVGKRNHADCLQFLRVRFQLGNGLRRLGNAGLFEQILVVDITDFKLVPIKKGLSDG
ncbi:hypothetical protein D3C81_1114250 [compost metagenome]